ncbi:hypothetical protein QE152_g24384 [Popillia japonica]|uniref:Uncharacterized protein n=1 Tax=Popillia japonica TaxID=7064 RepID=A0AAW1KFA9_POPJA
MLNEQDAVITNIVEMSKTLKLDLNENDFNELLPSHATELSNDDLLDLEAQSHAEDLLEEEREIEPLKEFDAKKWQNLLG